MSRNSELIKTTAILSFGKICTQFVQFLLLPLYTALLDPEEFGVVDIFNTYVILLVPLFNWQFERGLFRFMLDCRNDKERQKSVVSTVVIANILQSALFLLCYLIVQNHIESNFKVFLLIDVIATVFMNTLMQLSRGIGNNTVYAAGSFLSVFSSVLLNVFFIAGMQMGALGMFLATAISRIITVGYLFLSNKVWRYFKIRYFDKQIFNNVFHYSIPLVPNALSWWVISASNRSIITAFLGVAANGIFAIASKFSGVFITVYNVFDMAWTESVSLHLNDPDRDAYLTDTVNTVFHMFASACLLIIAAMPIIFPIMVDREYVQAYSQVPVLMIAALFQVEVGLFSAIYIALKKSNEIAKSSIFAAAINFFVNVVLIRFIGLYASSLASLCGYAAMGLYRYFDSKKYVNVKLITSRILILLATGTFVILCYYSGQTYLSVSAAVVALIYAVLVNKRMITEILRIVRKILDRMFMRKGNNTV